MKSPSMKIISSALRRPYGKLNYSDDFGRPIKTELKITWAAIHLRLFDRFPELSKIFPGVELVDRASEEPSPSPEHSILVPPYLLQFLPAKDRTLWRRCNGKLFENSLCRANSEDYGKKQIVEALGNFNQAHSIKMVC